MPETNKEYFTYGDYVKWPDDERWELIDGQRWKLSDGQPYAMTPTPTVTHQRISSRLLQQMMNFFEGKPCQAFHAPLDVRLPKGDETDEGVDTVVQPDLLVICDPAKIDEKGVRGAPDLVIEILSSSTVERDLGEKLFLYEKHGVRCHIIVDPWSRTFTLRQLEPTGKYGHPEIFAVGDTMPIGLFPGLAIDLARVFS